MNILLSRGANDIRVFVTFSNLKRKFGDCVRNEETSIAEIELRTYVAAARSRGKVRRIGEVQKTKGADDIKAS